MFTNLDDRCRGSHLLKALGFNRNSVSSIWSKLKPGSERCEPTF